MCKNKREKEDSDKYIKSFAFSLLSPIIQRNFFENW